MYVMKCVQTAAVLHVSVGRFGKQTYRGAGAVLLLHTQVEFAVQVDVTRLPRELEHVEGEVVGRSQSVALHLHRLVGRVRTAAQKQEDTPDVRSCISIPRITDSPERLVCV